jgi:hypothetical protein
MYTVVVTTVKDGNNPMLVRKTKPNKSRLVKGRETRIGLEGPSSSH